MQKDVGDLRNNQTIKIIYNKKSKDFLAYMDGIACSATGRTEKEAEKLFRQIYKVYRRGQH